MAALKSLRIMSGFSTSPLRTLMGNLSCNWAAIIIDSLPGVFIFEAASARYLDVGI